MMLPWVGLANKPFAAKATQIFQAVSLSSVSLITMALSKPFPRTKLTILLPSMYSFIFLRNNFPKLRAF